MSKSNKPSIPYDVYLSQAMIGVVRSVLKRISEQGLSRPHAINIAFKKNHPGVDMPDWLRAQLENEPVIILENQFGELEVSEQSFAVTLSFSRIPARLLVPFSAVTKFFDPGANVGFAILWHPAAETQPANTAPPDDGEAGNVISLAARRKNP